MIQAVLDADQISGNDPAFELMADNEEALHVFLSVRTQWKLEVGFGVAIYTGLDYAGVRSFLKESGWKKKQRKKLFRDLCVIEQGALSVINQTATKN